MFVTYLTPLATISWIGLLLFLVVLVVLHRISIFVYNIWFHPLRKFPGNKLWGISRIPSLYAVINGRIPHFVQEAHQRYGPVVRIGPDELSFVHQDAWKAIYVSREFVRPPKWASQPPGVKVHNLVSAPQDDHTRLRKALGQAFSDRAVKLQEPMINRYIDLMMEKLTQLVDESGEAGFNSNIIKWLSFTTFDIINEFSYGSTEDCLNRQDISPWKLVVSQYEARLRGVFLRYYPFLAYFGSLSMPTAAISALWKVKGIADAKANICINTKNANFFSTMKTDIEQKPSVLSHVFKYNSGNPSMAMTDEEILENSVILILAGGDPVTTVITGALHYLLQNPKAMQRLVEELRNAFPADGTNNTQVRSTSARALPYLNAVLNEAMRLCPPTPDIIRRTIPTGGTTIAGNFVPEGTIVGVSCFAAFRCQDNFVRPEAFEPERWLAGEESNGEGFYPFGIGAHNCLGQNLAWVELRLILARLLCGFDIELPAVDGYGRQVLPREWAQQPAYWAWDKDPLVVNIKKVTKSE